LLRQIQNRFVLFPIRYTDIWNLYKRAESAFWTAEEIDLSKDLTDWEALNDSERHFIKHILAFFAGSDGIVNENLAQRFMNDVSIPEAKSFYGFQIAMENIHSETYALLIDTYIKDPNEKHRLLNAIDTIPCIRRKAQWALRWIEDKEASFATRLVAFACIEGIFFSGAFCAIFWMRERGLMPGLTFSNELISRDEALHTEFAVLLYTTHVQNRLSEETIHDMVREAVNIENEFIIDAIPCRLLGMNSDLMTTYIQFVADRLLTQLGYEKLYHANNPFSFMDRICLDTKTNFFENRESNYAKANVGNVGSGGTMTHTDSHVFTIEEDF
jgi:ribonucleoside-diphosphate reductase beta chain